MLRCQYDSITNRFQGYHVPLKTVSYLYSICICYVDYSLLYSALCIRPKSFKDPNLSHDDTAAAVHSPSALVERLASHGQVLALRHQLV